MTFSNFAVGFERIKNNFTYAWRQEDLWKIAKNKKQTKNNKMKDIKHWIYHLCWNKKTVLFQSFKF